MNDFRLAMSRPDNVAVNTAFTDEVMRKIANAEINTNVLRTTNVKNDKETFIMKIRKLPAFATILIAIGLALTISASTYAIYQLFFQPSVIERSVGHSSDGRDQLVFNIESCGPIKGDTVYELKRNATISKSDARKTVLAQCELALVRDWAEGVTPQKYRSNKSFEDDTLHKSGENYTVYDSMLSTPMKVRSVDNNTIRMAKYDELDVSGGKLETNNHTRYVVDGRIQKSPEGISANDAIVYLSLLEFSGQLTNDCYDSECTVDGSPTKTIITYVVKLSLPFDTYIASAGESLTNLQPCENNTDDLCTINEGGITILQQPEVHFQHQDEGSAGFYRIQGKVVSYNADNLKLRSTSGTIYVIKTSTNIIEDFNRKEASDYENTTIEVGDSLSVGYYLAKGDAPTNITQKNVTDIMLDLEIIHKDSSIKKY